MLDEVAHVTLAVADTTASGSLYGEGLGLVEVPGDTTPAGGQIRQFAVGPMASTGGPSGISSAASVLVASDSHNFGAGGLSANPRTSANCRIRCTPGLPRPRR